MLADIRHIDPAVLRHPDALLLYRYWLKKRGNRSMPSREEIDPVEIPPQVLPGVSLIDVVPDERRYVYRLVGTGEVEARGFDPTGKSVMDGFLAPSKEDAVGCYDRVVAMREPLVDPVAFKAIDGRYVTEETIFLPLSDDGVTVNKILVFAACREVHEPPALPLSEF
ncbi:PAS domain-containing protein [Dongia deserti]|uniref:PAS domain-containing protein n=1 Tax=Dongia deserti TaxID=2268030 RepID=UPI000E64D9D1|nr:PAS domain-containing protein [Dongia deserti]